MIKNLINKIMKKDFISWDEYKKKIENIDNVRFFQNCNKTLERGVIND